MNISIGMVGILNFLVNFLLIVGTNSICSYPLSLKRSGLAAFLGAICAVARTNHRMVILQGNFCSIALLLLTSLASFGYKKESLRRNVVFILLNLALNGIALGFGQDGIWPSMLGAACVVLLCLLSLHSNAGKQQYVSVRIYHKNKTATVTALLDTGNTLHDPVSGAPVLVTDYQVAERLLGLTAKQLSTPLETLVSGQFPGLRIIPYTSVGQTSGMMLGLRVDRLLINGKEEQMIVAFAPQHIGRGKPFQALAGVIV